MSTLHTVNKSPFGNAALLSALRHAKPGDAVLMIEDGVYGALAGSAVAGDLQTAADGVTLCVLEGDIKARGIAPDKMMNGIKSVGYDGFVDLVTEHDRTQAWL